MPLSRANNIIGLLALLASVIWIEFPVQGAPNSPKTHAKEISPLEFLALDTPSLANATFEESFVAPNEMQPGDALPLLRNSPAAATGLYVRVGTERAYVGAALAKATALLLVDIDPQAVRFNRINRALLKTSRSREDYLKLRLHASQKDWITRGHLLPKNDLIVRPYLAGQEHFDWWHKRVRSDPGFVPLHLATESTSKGRPTGEWAFRAANYLHDAALFTHLKNLAEFDIKIIPQEGGM